MTSFQLGIWSFSGAWILELGISAAAANDKKRQGRLKPRPEIKPALRLSRRRLLFSKCAWELWLPTLA